MFKILFASLVLVAAQAQAQTLLDQLNQINERLAQHPDIRCRNDAGPIRNLIQNAARARSQGSMQSYNQFESEIARRLDAAQRRGCIQ